MLIVILYVDDMFVTGTNEEQIEAFMAKLNSSFNMSNLGLLHYFLGMEFKQCNDGNVIKQAKYIQSLLKRFNMEDCKPISTPAEPGVKLSLHDQGEPFDTTLYAQAVGCLIYLCNTRPDIQYSVSQMSKFMHSPSTKHWQAIKRIFRYLKGTMHFGLFYSKGGQFSMLAFSDSDWVGDYDTQ